MEYADTDYLTGFQYRSSYTEATGNLGTKELNYFPTSEGYVQHKEGRYFYVYNYTDHLGNIRLSYTLDQEVNMIKIMEENHYYPFGLKHDSYNTQHLGYTTFTNEDDIQQYVLSEVPKFVGDGSYSEKFNGKSWEDELGLNMYDFHARGYMPDIVRTPIFDPLQEEFYSMSPYSFLNNNPLRFTDPTGMAPDDLILKFHGNNTQEKMQSVLDQGLGKGVARIDDNGKVTLKGKCEDLKTEAQRGLFDVLSNPVNSENDITIDVYNSREDVYVGDMSGGKIDIGDINNFGTGELMNKFSVLGHEINEQFEYQSGNHLDYNEPNSSHYNSKIIESTINGGWTRGDSTSENDSSYKLDIPSLTSPSKVNVWSGSKTTHIKFTKGNETRIFTYQVKDFNIVPIK
jgi:RHS repeat-associated protein